MFRSIFANRHRPGFPRLWLIVATSLLVLAYPSRSGRAQEVSSGADYVAATVADPQVPTDQLQLMLRSLTQDELKTEADAWLNVVKSKVKQITDAELKRKRGETPQTDDTTNELVTLSTEQTALIDHMGTVLAELKKKGGDVQSYETYVNAISGLSAISPDADAVRTYLASWLRSPEGGMRWAKSLGSVLIILVVFWILAKFTGHAVAKAINRQRSVSNLLKNFAIKWAGRAVLIIGLLVALGAVGVEITPMLTALGAGGFILAFALQETLGNFAAGMMIMLYRPFDVDDFVDMAGVAGTVKQVSLVSTRLVTPDNRVLIIPNNSVWGGTITNVTGSDTRRVDLVFGIGYDDDIEKAVGILQRLVLQHELILDEPKPNIQVNELADSSVNLICRPWVKTGDYWTVRWDLTRQVKEQFDHAGVSIPFPQQDVHMHQAQA